MNALDPYKPAAGKFWLFISAAMVWSGVGFYLDILAFHWLREINLCIAILYFCGGLILAAAIYAAMFKRFADQNIARIKEIYGERVCIFAFQRWASYPLVVIMMSMGIYLRIYSPIPKPLLAILYIGIGSSLFFASLRYFQFLAKRADYNLSK